MGKRHILILSLILCFCIVPAFAAEYQIEQERASPRPEMISTGIVKEGNYMFYADEYLPFMNEVFKLNPEDASIISSAKAGSRGAITGIAFDGSTVYCFQSIGGPILKFDPNTMELLGQFKAPGHYIHDLTFGDGYLWALKSDTKSNFRVYKIDPSNGNVVGSFIPPSDQRDLRGIAWDGTNIWISEGNPDKLYKIDQKVALITGSSKEAVIEDYEWPFEGALHWEGEFLWTTAWTGDGSRIFKIKLGAGDSDGDGVLDEVDKCPNSVYPEEVPRLYLKPKHYSDVDSDGYFESVEKKNESKEDVIPLSETYGCTCTDILNLAPGDVEGEKDYGCSEGTMNIFRRLIGWAKNLFV